MGHIKKFNAKNAVKAFNFAANGFVTARRIHIAMALHCRNLSGKLGENAIGANEIVAIECAKLIKVLAHNRGAVAVGALHAQCVGHDAIGHVGLCLNIIAFRHSDLHALRVASVAQHHAVDGIPARVKRHGIQLGIHLRAHAAHIEEDHLHTVFAFLHIGHFHYHAVEHRQVVHEHFSKHGLGFVCGHCCTQIVRQVHSCRCVYRQHRTCGKQNLR